MHGSLQSRIGTARSSGRAVHLGWLPYRGRLVLADDDGVALLCRHQPSTYSLSRCPTWFPRQAAAAGAPAILAPSAPRPDQLHSQCDHLFVGNDVGLRWTRRRDVLVLEPLAA